MISKEQLFESGNEFYQDMMLRGKRESLYLKIAIGGLFLICLGLIITITIMLPLKEHRPYVIMVDKNTGYVEANTGIIPQNLTQNDAITYSNVSRYITAREGYSGMNYRENYKLVTGFSAGSARRDYMQEWSSSNKDRLDQKYGNALSINVEITEVNFMDDNKNRIYAKFTTYTKRKTTGSVEVNKYNAIIRFEYVMEPTKLKERLLNPLGFQVTEYRRETEIPSSYIDQE